MEEQKIKDFCDITGANAQRAQQILQVCDGNLDQAIFLEFEEPSRCTSEEQKGSSMTKGAKTKMSPDLVTWSQDYCDFALVVDSGEALSCHKIYLAKSSPFFKAMLDSEMIETQTNQMKIKDFDVETVASLLSYIYSDKNTALGLYNMFKRIFDARKLTPELMRLGHMYEVQDLVGDCTIYLAENVNDANVVTIWMCGETCASDKLREAAFTHLVNSPNREGIMSCPNMDQVFKSAERNKELVGAMVDELIKVKSEAAGHVAEKTQLTAALNAAQKQVENLNKSLAKEKTISVNINMPEGGYVGDFKTLVKRSKTLGHLKDQFLISDEDDNEAYENFVFVHNGHVLDEDKTFEYYNLNNNCTLQIEWDQDNGPHYD